MFLLEIHTIFIYNKIKVSSGEKEHGDYQPKPSREILAKSIETADVQPGSDIPNLDLYMDRSSPSLEEKLSGNKRREEENCQQNYDQ